MTRKYAVICSCIFLAVCLAASPGFAKETADELSYLEGFTLVVLDSDDIASLHAARNLIHERGGQIAIMSPPNVLMGWVPTEMRDDLVGQAAIRDIYYSEVRPQQAAVTDEKSIAMVEFFNKAVRRDLQREHDEFLMASPQREKWAGGDAIPAPPVEQDAYLKNLMNAGVNVDDQPNFITSKMGNSDFMTGTVALTVFFVESDGSIDPNLYTWTPEDMQNYLAGVATGLAFWSSQAPLVTGCSVSWLINYYSGFDPICQQPYEPVTHASNFEGNWINPIMTNLGYNFGNYFTKVNSFNTFQRSFYGTDRSYTAFVPYNPTPAATQFTDGRTAYAYLGGPFTVLLFRSGTAVPNVFAHESGHIFFACDEYIASGCGCTQGCGNGILNANCEGCPDDRDCVMMYNDLFTCEFTKGQVGWGANNPCSPPPPPPLATPTIATSSPPSGLVGTELTITINGTNYFPGTQVDMGPDIFVHSTTLNGSTQLVLDITIINRSPNGLVDVTVQNTDGQSATLPLSFEVLPTLQHYFAATGSNTFPYVTPATAANSLDDAISAAADGDVVLVPTMQFIDFSIILGTGVLLQGAWDNTFTTRDLASGKTTLSLNGNITLSGSLGGGFDGFIIENGTGASGVVPFPGDFGGGIRILTSTATIANCEIRLNAATDGTGDAAGGGIFAENSTVDLHDNDIHDNTATQGAGIYLFSCDGNISGNTISNNVVTGAGLPAEGAGIMLVDCSNMTADNNNVSTNTGAVAGGGVRLVNSTNVSMTGGSITDNDATAVNGNGGGIRLDQSSLTMSGVTVSGNDAFIIGGGVDSRGASSLTMKECVISTNTAILGGGIYADDGTANIDHNLFVSNTGTSAGGALFMSGAVTGSAIGNTFDQNSSPGTGGMSLPDLAITAFNNIVANSTGVGISCGGSSSLLLSHNLVWNSSGGDYSGCVPGSGSIIADPLFVNPAGGDYRLALHSPAIDTGNPNSTYDDPDGSRGDMGRYGSHSFVMDQPAAPQGLNATVSGPNIDLSWTANSEGDLASYAVYCDTTMGFAPSSSNFVTLVAAPATVATVASLGDSNFYKVSVVDLDGYASGYSNEASTSTATAIDSPVPDDRFTLRQNVPNPFNPVTLIAYAINERVAVTLEVYDVNGRLVRTLINEIKEPGEFAAEWNAKNDMGAPVSTGIYFYRLTAGNFTQTRKMVLLK